MHQLEELPLATLLKIFSFLSLKDLLSSCTICSTFLKIFNLVYFQRRRKELKQLLISTENIIEKLTYKEVKQIFTSKFGEISGLWRENTTHYGGLFQVYFDGYKIVAYRYLTSKKLCQEERNSKQKLFFTAYPLNKDKFIIIYHCRLGSFKEANIIVNNEDTFCFTCLDNSIYQEKKLNKQDFKNWMAEEVAKVNTRNLDDDTFYYRENLLYYKYSVFLETKEYEFTRIKEYNESCNASNIQLPIKPGFFESTFSLHGNEIVQLVYDKYFKNIEVIKITGDPNIPTGKITVKVDLQNRFITPLKNITTSETDWIKINNISGDLKINNDDGNEISNKLNVVSLDNKSNCEEIPEIINNESLDVMNKTNKTNNLFKFYLSDSVNFVQDFDVPYYYKERYRSNAQIAAHSYTDPSFIEAQFVIFDEDRFGNYWLKLSAFCFFSRISRKLFTPELKF